MADTKPAEQKPAAKEREYAPDDYVRAVVNADGAQATVHYSAAKASGWQILDKPAVNADGVPLPTKYRK